MLKTVIIVGPRRDKTCLRFVRQSYTQTSSLSYRDWLENEGSDTIKLSDIFGYLRELKPAMRAFYSEIVTLFIILLVIPAANAPLTERTFSALRRVKTYSRSTMTQTRMNNLITIHVHKERTDAFELKAIANEFTARNERRRGVFGKF